MTTQGQIGIYLREDGVWDLGLNEDDGEHLQLDQSWHTAVTISLLTDARASKEDDPQSPTLLGGFWGDSYPQVPGRPGGSKLWLLRGRKATAETLGLAKTYCEQALAWLVEDGAAEEVLVTIERVSDTVVGARIFIRRPREPKAVFAGRWMYTL